MILFTVEKMEKLTYSKGQLIKFAKDKILARHYMLDIYYTFGNYRMVRIHGR